MSEKEEKESIPPGPRGPGAGVPIKKEPGDLRRPMQQEGYVGPTLRETGEGLRRKRNLKIAAVLAIIVVVSVGVAVAVILSQPQPAARVTETEYIGRMSGILSDYSRSLLQFADTFELYVTGFSTSTVAEAALGEEFLAMGAIQDRLSATAVPCVAYQSMHEDVTNVFTATLNAEARILDFVRGDVSGLADANVGFNLAAGLLTSASAKIDTLETTLPNCAVG